MNEYGEWKINFDGHVVLVTGAASGIGLGISEGFLKSGATVIGADYDEEGLKASAETLGNKFVPRKCDLTSVDQIVSLKDFVDESFGKLDVLINNAGRARYAGPEIVTEDDFHFQYDIFVKGPILTIRHFIPLLRKSANPNIVNIGSLNAKPLFEANMTGIYGSAKAALTKYTRYLARELPGIRSNVVHPGCVDTPVYGKAGLSEEQIQAIFDNFKEKIPCGRVGEPKDIADCILFLCSEKASYINGTSILVDGGWSTVADWGW